MSFWALESVIHFDNKRKQCIPVLTSLNFFCCKFRHVGRNHLESTIMGQKESTMPVNTVSNVSPSNLHADSNHTIENARECLDEQLLKRCKNVHCDLDAWFKVIQSETFYTEFIPISPAVAQAFFHFYQTRYMSRKSLDSKDIQLIQSIQSQLKEQIFSSKTKKIPNN